MISTEVDEYGKDNPFGLETESSFHETRKNTTIALIHEYSNSAKDLGILDVGCGRGDITHSMALSFPNAHIDAIDISPMAIQMAKATVSSINFTCMDAMLFKGFGYKYNFIVLNNIYEHVENPTGLLNNLKKYLEEDGMIIISTPNRYHIRNVLRKLLGKRITIPPYHITEYSIGQLYEHHSYCSLKIKCILFPKFRRERIRTKDIIFYKLIQPIFDTYLKTIRSRTRLGTLLFIVSKLQK